MWSEFSTEPPRFGNGLEELVLEHPSDERSTIVGPLNDKLVEIICDIFVGLALQQSPVGNFKYLLGRDGWTYVKCLVLRLPCGGTIQFLAFLDCTDDHLRGSRMIIPTGMDGRLKSFEREFDVC